MSRSTSRAKAADKQADVKPADTNDETKAPEAPATPEVKADEKPADEAKTADVADVADEKPADEKADEPIVEDADEKPADEPAVATPASEKPMDVVADDAAAYNGAEETLPAAVPTEVASNEARAGAGSAVTSPNPDQKRTVGEVITQTVTQPSTALIEPPAERVKADDDTEDSEGRPVSLVEAAAERLASQDEVIIRDDKGAVVDADAAFSEDDGSGEVQCLIRLVETSYAQPFNRKTEVLLCGAGSRLPATTAEGIKKRIRASA